MEVLDHFGVARSVCDRFWFSVVWLGHFGSGFGSLRDGQISWGTTNGISAKP